VGLPADIAATVAFFASEDAGFVSGQTLHVNGGQR
jgi:3-oxoacyl-[acyl-carrier protein] reductase